MNNTSGMISCALGCWLVAALGGALGAVLLALLGGWTFMQAVFAGLVIAGVAGLLVSWIMCKPLPAIGEANTATAPQTAAKDDAPAPAPKEATPAPAPKAAEAAPAATAAPATKTEAPAAKADAAPAAAPAKKPAAAPKAKPAPKAKADPDPAPADAGTGKKPETLTAARDGGPDDLKQIKGVGPKLEALLHSMGFYHFDQIAAWGGDEVAWVDQNLQGFKGRVSRDSWVDQAKVLAEGGSTEFSSKVKKGGVY